MKVINFSPNSLYMDQKRNFSIENIEEEISSILLLMVYSVH